MVKPSSTKESVFDSASEIYNSVRPSYPEILIDDLVKAGSINFESRILEIGPGTGKLTSSLARRGFQVYGVELGKKLAETAKNNLKLYPNVKIDVQDFDKWDFEQETFDLVVSATAYHWLDQDTRVDRIYDILKRNGMVAIIDTVHIDSRYDNFPKASQKCYSEWVDNSTGQYHHPTVQEAIETGFKRKNEFIDKFNATLDKPYTQNVTYDSQTYVRLLQTYSDVISMPEARKDGFLNCIGDMIENEFNNTITKSYLWQLFVARKK